MKIKEEWNNGPPETKFVHDKKFEEYYELLKDGSAVCLNEYCTWIADTRYEERFTELSEEKQKESEEQKTDGGSRIDVPSGQKSDLGSLN